MEIAVLLEPAADGGFTARSGDPLDLRAEGDTPDSALRNLRDLIKARMDSGSLLTTIELPRASEGRHPGAGIYRDEPLFDQWRAAIASYRQEVEDALEIP
jgi:predicted RNase H-like HicB family nuclease